MGDVVPFKQNEEGLPEHIMCRLYYLIEELDEEIRLEAVNADFYD